MLVGLDVHCKCGSDIIARKCCMKVRNCKVEYVTNCTIVFTRLIPDLTVRDFSAGVSSLMFCHLKIDMYVDKSSKIVRINK